MGGSARVAAGAGKSTVAMGRNMSQRVIPYAEKNGYGYYPGTPSWVPRQTIGKVSQKGLERIDMSFNKQWINHQMKAGNRVVDIGEIPGMPASKFYNMERQQVSGYSNYFRDPQP